MELCLYAMEEAMHVLGAALLSLAALLLFEELTFGGLARLLLAPPGHQGKQQEAQPEATQPDATQPDSSTNNSSIKPGNSIKQSKFKGESQCSR